MTMPNVVFTDSSGVSALAPFCWATGLVGGNVAMSASMPIWNSVVTLRRFACPAVGTRKPVLTAPRSATLSPTCRRAAILPSSVLP